MSQAQSDCNDGFAGCRLLRDEFEAFHDVITEEGGIPAESDTSHVTRHTSHVTRHTSHVTPERVLQQLETWQWRARYLAHYNGKERAFLYVACRSVTCHTSRVTRHTSHVTRRTSHVTRHTSHVTPAANSLDRKLHNDCVYLSNVSATVCVTQSN